MSYLDYQVLQTPTGWRKLLYLNWPLILLITAVAGIGFLMLVSVAGGDVDRWAKPQMYRFAAGMVIMIGLGFVPMWFWRGISVAAYIGCFLLLVGVEVAGEVGMGARRWIDFGPIRVQPSELMKIALVLLLAAYYDWLPLNRVSRPLWVLLPVVLILAPTGLVIIQPDLGTSIMLVAGGGIVMFAAGVSLWYFGAVIGMAVGLVATVLESRGTDWQLLKDYQFRRIDTFLDPAADPLGAGYNIIQSQIALGSGGWSGRGFMQGTQSRLNFLPEKHTDFIFTVLAEEFGFIGAVSLLVLYTLIVGFCLHSALTNRDRFASLITIGISGTFFLYFAINMATVMGLIPAKGSPLPLISYGGTSLMILMLGFGLVQSAHVHRSR
ncbi:MAG: rod shape-determining protein RodA [Paracoccus sp. (in: a-proteobacteria)]|jgi:rod shape determining protein RodA|uniref:rod shape-determining protein RodA n=1 Tax=unclassified Paracoccus (in: a-proteobacteria) TaxID=2688777 RepID=UPI000C5F8BA8|nr:MULTISPECIES: rod shape-determining protein RodA [unclassified Paracoccus (in: a-proteobacteria)]MAN56030.1 rod shape-determining protein RodA [Paracoccus sp. (in: a-proteobacteria)]MBA47649.1 rod shape-determining protein RodA [Paracoccus sp. (in: a-proteobacteria)]MCS5603228.1 rod shape-determining protein RodA [Paracoccus sp. (in: a-proteobacteria)]|tara:strand:+ start:183 stop:1322 length:1140 start_codon:yes stop_codon:yes gene_type:complete